MIERQKRLQEVYKYVRQNFDIHTQNDFAAKTKYSRVYISAALNGYEHNLTDKLFKSICETFPDTFNLDYLLNGEGELLIPQEPETAAPTMQQESNILEVFARMIRQLDDMRAEMKRTTAELAEARDEFRKARDEYRAAINGRYSGIKDNAPAKAADDSPL